MFNSLKKKLSSFKNSFGDILDKQAEEASEDIQQAGSKSVTKEEKKETPSVAVGIGQKAKALLLNREFIISEKKLEEPLWNLEVALLESDVALEVAEEVVGYVKSELVGTNYKIGGNKNDIVEQALRKALINVLNVETLDFDDYIEQANKPVNIAFVGVNGTGKTTTISKIAKRLKDRGYSVVLAAGDTFRAGAIDQLQRHADNLGLKMIKHQEGGDPAAVLLLPLSQRTRSPASLLRSGSGCSGWFDGTL